MDLENGAEGLEVIRSLAVGVVHAGVDVPLGLHAVAPAVRDVMPRRTRPPRADVRHP